MSVQIKIRDGLRVCKHAILPGDRPSALFSLFTCIINGGLLVWSFSTALSTTCLTASGRWMYCGMANCIVNMVFAIVVMVTVRSKISRSIPLGTSYTRLFLLSPTIIAYLIFLIWEIVWMLAASQSIKWGAADPCFLHIPVQVGFLFLYILVGLPLFVLTFATEAWRLPRWRQYASIPPEERVNVSAAFDPPLAGDDVASLGGGRHAAGEPTRPSGPHRVTHDDRNTEMTSVVDYASMMNDRTTMMSTVRGEGRG